MPLALRVVVELRPLQAAPLLLERGDDLVPARVGLLLRLAAHLDHEPAPAVGQERQLVHVLAEERHVLDQQLVDALEAERPVLHHGRHVLGGRRRVLVTCDDERAPRRAVEQVHGRLEHGHARPLGAGERPRDVEALLRQEVVEVVARDAPRDPRVAPAHEVAVAVGQLLQLRRQRVGHACAVGADAQSLAAIGEHLELVHVVGAARPGSVELRHHRAHATGVRADHPAERAVLVCGRIGPERESVFLGALTEPVEHHARLHAREPALRVDVEDAVEVLGEVEHDRDVDRLAREARAAAARHDRRLVLAAGADRGDDVLRRTRKDDADRQLPVVRARARVERPVAGREADLAFDGRA